MILIFNFLDFIDAEDPDLNLNTGPYSRNTFEGDYINPDTTIQSNISLNPFGNDELYVDKDLLSFKDKNNKLQFLFLFI